MRFVNIFFAVLAIAFLSKSASAQQQNNCVKDNVGNVYCPPPKSNVVDLSRVGLEGQDSYYKNREAEARAKALEAQARTQEAQAAAYRQQQAQSKPTQQTDGAKRVECLRVSTDTVICPNQTGELRLYRVEK